MLQPSVCRHDHFLTDWYARQCGVLGFPSNIIEKSPAGYRKIWEWTSILQALEERGMLKPGRRGLGFAVGTEKLSSVFASRGVEVLATDKLATETEEQWLVSGQHAASSEALYHPACVSEDDFNRLVRFAPADMTELDSLDGEQFDFLWSSCAFEHLGSLDAGTRFVKEAMRLLKPGGIAVHTTEFNCSSNTDTARAGPNVIYRRCDLEQLASDLVAMGYSIGRFNYDIGNHRFDWDFDSPPFFTGNGTHIKLFTDGYVATSCLIIVEKPAVAQPPKARRQRMARRSTRSREPARVS